MAVRDLYAHKALGTFTATLVQKLAPHAVAALRFKAVH